MAPRRKRSEPSPPRSLKPRVYRPATSHNVLVAFAACVFLAIALGCSQLGPPREQFLAYPLGGIGLFLALIGTARFRTRIVVRDEGLSRSPWFPMGFGFTWDDVDYWNVRRIDHIHWDHPSFTAAHFVLHGGRRPIQVAEEDVHRPGFETFLRDLRRHIGGRER